MLEEEVRCERESVWEINKCGQIERDRGNENRIAKSIYMILSNSRQIEVSRGVKTSVEEGVKKKQRQQMQLSRNKAKTQEEKLDRSTSYRGSRNFLN